MERIPNEYKVFRPDYVYSRFTNRYSLVLVLYNIPVSVNSLAKNTFGTGTLGNNSLNGMAAYAPPCSQGTGFKKYILTIYALTDSVTTTVPKPEVSMNVLVDAIKNITLAEASLTVKYSRIIDW